MPLTGKVTFCVAAAALTVCGCANWNFSQPFPPPPTSSPAPAKKVRDLETDLAAARSENVILRSRLEAVTARETQLADSLREQQFLAEQGERQIKVLAKAPGERERYKARCEELEAQVLRLETDYAQLKQAAAAAGVKIPPRVTSQPATRPSIHPTVRPATEPGEH
jgi:predicted  nucleic acid-binding Zn-ribbon protein